MLCDDVREQHNILNLAVHDDDTSILLAGKLHVLGLLMTDYVTLLCENEKERQEHLQLQSSLTNLAGTHQSQHRIATIVSIGQLLST